MANGTDSTVAHAGGATVVPGGNARARCAAVLELPSLDREAGGREKVRTQINTWAVSCD